MNEESLVAAGLVRRSAAFVLDVILATGVASAAALLASGGSTGAAFAVLVWVGVALAVAICQWLLRARRGWSVGQLALGLATVDEVQGAPIGLARSVRRTAVLLAGGLIVGLGAVVVLVSPAFDRSGRRVGWHDELAGSWVVRRRQEQATEPAAVEAEPSLRVVRPAASARPAPTGEVPVLAFGLMPELERTRPSPRHREGDDGTSGYTPLRAELELSDGSWQVVQGVVLVGRNPIAGPGETTIRMADPLLSISRTHLRLSITPDGVRAEDLGSSNGTMAILPSGRQIACLPGRPVPLPAGTVLSLGDAWIRLAGTSAERSAFPDATIRR